MYGADISCPGTPNPHTLGAFLEGLCEANAAWYFAERKAGREPPCCSKCAGVVYEPDSKATSHRFTGMDEMIANPGRGWSCKEIAAFDAGVARGKSLLTGATAQHARSANFVRLQNRGARKFHALVVAGGQEKDPSRTLKRSAE